MGIRVIFALFVGVILASEQVSGATIIVTHAGPTIVSPSGVIEIASSPLKSPVDHVSLRPRAAFFVGQEPV